MRLPAWTTAFVALITAAVVFLIGQAVIQPNRPLILTAKFDSTTITPNADGDNDVTAFRYELSRNADVTLSLRGADGTVYVFRDHEPRVAQPYSVLFSGVVNGYTRPDEKILGTVERRLLANGDYTWTLTAENPNETQTIEGTLTIAEANAPLPIISTFTSSTSVFSPNQDGVSDRVEINVYLEHPADLRVFLVGPNNEEYPITARKEGRLPGEAGRQIFDYEGGIDLKAEPPPDGTYTIVAIAQDEEGQRIQRETQLTIVDGGKPLAEIAAQGVGVDVVFDVQPYDEKYFTDKDTKGELISPPNDPGDRATQSITMQLGDMLVFMLTVENYSEVPIRTTGPMPGTVYEQTQVAAALGEFVSPGAWRVGIQCETSTEPFPYRWAVGSADTLINIENPDTGEIFTYLPAGASSVVWGAVHMTKIEQLQNPQNCWAGLIQEDVEVSLRNSVVGQRDIMLVDPEAEANE
jgi:hypothetical protein